MMNMNTQGMIEKTCFCTGSIGCGLSLNCSHMVMPRRIGRMPSARKAGGVKSR